MESGNRIDHLSVSGAGRSESRKTAPEKACPTAHR
jgi:hypothetical protein